VVIIAGSGPSLRSCEPFLPTDKGVTIAINEAMSYLPSEKVDFGFGIDRVAKQEWAEGMGNTPMITNAVTNHDLLSRMGKKYFFRYPQDVTTGNDDRLLDRAPDKYRDLPMLDQGRTATFSAMHLAYKAGAKKVILVGQDCSSTTELYSAGTRMSAKRFRDQDWNVTEGMTGKPVLTCRRMQVHRSFIKGAAYWMGKDGVETVNASGRGLVNFDGVPNSATKKNFNIQPEQIPHILKEKDDEHRAKRKKNINIEASENLTLSR